jgi:hypothetical protein
MATSRDRLVQVILNSSAAHERLLSCRLQSRLSCNDAHDVDDASGIGLGFRRQLQAIVIALPEQYIKYK